jgi:hypothetical protein
MEHSSKCDLHIGDMSSQLPMLTRIIRLNLVHLIDQQAMTMPTKGRSLESPYLKVVFQQLLKAGLQIKMR